MPQYLAVFEAEGFGYPFLVEAPDKGRATAKIKRYWDAQQFGDYDALRLETVKKTSNGIARPNRLNVPTYQRLSALVHNCLLDIQEGQVAPDHVLHQLCTVLTEVLPASVAHEVFEIVSAHERVSRDQDQRSA